MTEILPPWPTLGAFLLASVVLSVTPGPGVLFIVARSLSQGRRAGLVCVASVALGNLGNAIAASAGLAALFTASSVAFGVVKYMGAAYLIYLGIQTLRSASSIGLSMPEPAVSNQRVFREGLVVALLNPKTTLFYAAFLPQFVAQGAAPVLQSAALGLIFVAIAATTDALYALGAGGIGRMLHRRSGLARGGRMVAGGTFIGLGLFAMLARSAQK